MRKIVDFFVGVHRGASTIHTPPTHAQAQGVLGGVVGSDASDDGKLHHRECNLLYFMRFGVILTGGTPRLAILAPQSHGKVLPPCDCGTRIVSMPF
jgi:hypothetical protein